MPSTTNFGWTTPADTDLVKDGAAAIRTLGNGVDASFVDLKGGTTGQILSKNSNTDLDFVWIANDQGDITAVTAGTGISGGGTSGAVTITNSMATEITASGDIIVGTGSGTFDNLPIGTTGQVLTADTTVSPYKVKWATPAGGGKVLQVVSTTKTDTSSMSSNSFASTGLSVTITPTSSNSKVLVFATCYFGVSNSNSLVGARLQRGSTVICVGDAAGSRPLGSGYADFMGHETRMLQSNAFHVLDTPATTSATTYEVYFRTYTSGGDTIYLNRSGSDRNTADYDWRLASTITAMEIGA